MMDDGETQGVQSKGGANRPTGLGGVTGSEAQGQPDNPYHRAKLVKRNPEVELNRASGEGGAEELNSTSRGYRPRGLDGASRGNGNNGGTSPDRSRLSR